MTTTTRTNPSILTSLRALTPTRQATFDEALRIAELQATILSRRLDPAGDGLREHHLADLPRVLVTYEQLPVSGLSYWNGRCWVIAISKTDGLARQRFTLLHEFKHVVDHGRAAQLYRGQGHYSPAEQAERAADYFAGCALVPKRQLKSAWGNAMQRIPDLASHFGVSEHAIRVRLAQTGLNQIDTLPTARCARPTSTPAWRGQTFRLARTGSQRR